ncbi:MAG: hypothetical protein J6R68_03380 [Clostridia bacterium]|nr:hypothetical protein [Clostridia bacterium]MBO7288672.1 hypothetical protein [Clostridia bacterium]
MINTTFEVYKIKREIKRSGKSFLFKRPVLNEFSEPKRDEQGEFVSDNIGSIFGLYHEQNGSIQINTGDTTQTRTKKIPSILCCWDDISVLNLVVGDFVVFNSNTYKITGIVNIQEWNLIADISLELVDYGI